MGFFWEIMNKCFGPVNFAALLLEKLARRIAVQRRTGATAGKELRTLFELFSYRDLKLWF